MHLLRFQRVRASAHLLEDCSEYVPINRGFFTQVDYLIYANISITEPLFLAAFFTHFL